MRAHRSEPACLMDGTTPVNRLQTDKLPAPACCRPGAGLYAGLGACMGSQGQLPVPVIGEAPDPNSPSLPPPSGSQKPCLQN